jgi:hypothetical protein
MLEATRLYARRLGCIDELERVGRLIDEPPAERQRALGRVGGPAVVTPALADVFCDSCTASPDAGSMVAG